MVLLPLAVWACARFWWFNVGETELGDLREYCGQMPPLLAVVTACFTFFMLPPWRARQHGAGAWLRRAVAFAGLAAGSFWAEVTACCCCVGYCEWSFTLLLLAGAGVLFCIAAMWCRFWRDKD